MNVGSVFSGIGLLDYGLCLAGLQHAWFCEADPWRREILRTRWPGVPVHDDIRTLGAANARRVDVVAGGFPCKGASTAGKRNGFDHPETVLWREMFRAIRELRPRYARWASVLRPRLMAWEQVPPVLELWSHCAGLLKALGYHCWTGILSAERYGVPQTRRRAILMASLDGQPHPPAPTHQAYVPGQPARHEQTLEGELLPWVSMSEALGWSEDAKVQHRRSGERLEEEWSAGRPSDTVSGRIDRWQVNVPAPTVTGGGGEAGGPEPFGRGGRQRIARAIAEREGRE